MVSDINNEIITEIKKRIKGIVRNAKRNNISYRNELEIPKMRQYLISEGVPEELINDVITKYEYN